jgi:hypothetical protein
LRQVRCSAQRQYVVRVGVGLLLQVFWRVFHTLDEQLPRAGDTPAVTAGWHRRILSAPRAGDEPGMRAAVVEHFQGIRARTSGRVET